MSLVVDLEDARRACRQAARRGTRGGALERPVVRGVVRVNAGGDPGTEADLAAVVLRSWLEPAQKYLVLLRAAVRPRGAGRWSWSVWSALGIADARPLLAERPDAAYVGTRHIADLGCDRRRRQVLSRGTYVAAPSRACRRSTRSSQPSATPKRSGRRRAGPRPRLPRQDLPPPVRCRSRTPRHAVGGGAGARPRGARRRSGRGRCGGRADGGRRAHRHGARRAGARGASS